MSAGQASPSPLRRAAFALIAALVAAVVGVWCWGGLAYGYGPWDAALALVVVDDGATLYAEGYDEQRFHDLAPGADVDTLLAALGQPISRLRQEDGSSAWYYSKQSEPPAGAHHRRVVMVSATGRVARTQADVLVD